MRRFGLLFLCWLLAGCIPQVDFEHGVSNGVVTTTAPPPPSNLGPEPIVIPTGGRTIIMRPGGTPTPEQLDFMQGQPGYIEGSGRVEAYAPGIEGLNAVLAWESDGSGFPPGPGPAPAPGRMACDGLGPASGVPQSWGCGSATDWNDNNKVGGLGYTTGQSGRNEIEVHHAPGASATVVELADGTTYLIRPLRTSTISYYEWNGPPSARVTVFWPDGSRVSRLTTP